MCILLALAYPALIYFARQNASRQEAAQREPAGRGTDRTRLYAAATF